MVAQHCSPSSFGGLGGLMARSGDRDHPGQRGEASSLLKVQRVSGHGGTHL